MKMYSNIYKIKSFLSPLLLGLISMTTLPSGCSSPTTVSPITAIPTKLNDNLITENNTVNNTLVGYKHENRESIISDNSLTDESIQLKSYKTVKQNKQNDTPFGIQYNGSDAAITRSDVDVNSIKTPEQQLTALSGIESNTPSIKTNSDSTSLPFLSSTDSMLRFSSNNVSENNLNQSLTNINKQQTQLAVPHHQNVEKSIDKNRFKRSHFFNSLHTNFDQILNMKRERPALRLKRNSDYEDFVASILAAENAKYNDYKPYRSESTNDVNVMTDPKTLSYILNRLSEDNNIDSDKLVKYYYENVLPLLQIESEPNSDEESGEEIPVYIQPYAQQVIPVLPYPLPNRYQRIRRNYYSSYRNPLSLYTGLKRKRTGNNYDRDGEWGRIVGAKEQRAVNDDEADEATKIYSLATLLATGSTPESNSQRYKRSVKTRMNIM